MHAYPSGGGDYEVVTKNLGPDFGLLVASALLVDYILTVAVSTAAGVANIGSAIQVVGEHPVWFSIGIIVLVCALNLRGIRESGVGLRDPGLRVHLLDRRDDHHRPGPVRHSAPTCRRESAELRACRPSTR